MREIAGAACLVLLSACSPPPQDRNALAAVAAQRQPADARLANLYSHACRNCHANVSSGAPLTGDREAWHDRWRKGLSVLLTHTLQGFNGMPAGGQCFSCTSADYTALIRFMSDAEHP